MVIINFSKRQVTKFPSTKVAKRKLDPKYDPGLYLCVLVLQGTRLTDVGPDRGGASFRNKVWCDGSRCHCLRPTMVRGRSWSQPFLANRAPFLSWSQTTRPYTTLTLTFNKALPGPATSTILMLPWRLPAKKRSG